MQNDVVGGISNGKTNQRLSGHYWSISSRNRHDRCHYTDIISNPKNMECNKDFIKHLWISKTNKYLFTFANFKKGDYKSQKVLLTRIFCLRHGNIPTIGKVDC